MGAGEGGIVCDKVVTVLVIRKRTGKMRNDLARSLAEIVQI